MMEGEQILADFKARKDLKRLVSRVEYYLEPVTGTPLSSRLATFELFSLKLLKLCTEHLPTFSAKGQRSMIFSIGSTCVKSLQHTSGVSGKSPKLAFEKILLHYSRACLLGDSLDEGERACAVLYSRLREEAMERKCSTEECNLLKHAYDMMWKASVKNDSTIQAAGKSLQLRKLALKCLFASGESKLAVIIGKVAQCDQLYLKAIRTSSQSDIPQELYANLYDFHTSVIPIGSLISGTSGESACPDVIILVQYILHVAVLCVQSGHPIDSRALVSRAKDVVATHQSLGTEGDHKAVTVQAHAVEVWMTLYGETRLSEECLIQLDELSDSLHSLTGPPLTHPAPSTLHKLIESLELVIVSVLRKHKDSFISECSSLENSMFDPVESLLTDTVACLDEFLKRPPQPHPSTLQQKGRARQLQLLRFLGDALVDVLTFDDEDDIEVLRSSSAAPLPPFSPPPLRRADLAASCYPVLKQSQDILRKAGDVLCVSEHRWLGTDAYKIGLALLNRERLEEACDVLSLSTEELTMWVAAGGEEVAIRANEVHLLEIFLKLIDVQRKVCQPVVAMGTITRTLLSIPVVQLSSCVNSLVSHWVKAKRDLISSGASSCEDQGWVVTKGAEALPIEIRKQFVEAELRLCKASSLSPSVTLPVVDQLLSLYSLTDSSDDIIARARVTVEKAILLRGRGSPLSLLEEAMVMLEPLVGVRAYEQLAVTHLWRAICVAEQQIASCDLEGSFLTSTNDRDPLSKEDIEVEIGLSPDQNSMMMSEDITQCLHSSADCWEKMSQTFKNEPSLSDPFLTLQYLQLTAQLSLAHSQPDLALRCLRVLLDLTPLLAGSTLTHTVKLTALANYCQLLDTISGAGDTCRTTINDNAFKVYLEDKPSRREAIKLRVAQLNCQLALARTHLRQGQFDRCRDILLSMLKDFALEEPCSMTFDLVAKAKLLVADLLQQRMFDMTTARTFLHGLADTSSSHNEGGGFSLTPLELVIDACRLFTKLADHKKVLEMSLNQDQQGAGCTDEPDQCAGQRSDSIDKAPTFSSSVGAWQILVSVLDSLRTLSRAYLSQGNTRKAHSKAREGAMMAKLTLLQGWYVEFLLLLIEIHTVSGAHSFAQIHSSQASKLLECETCSYLNSLVPTGGKKEVESVERVLTEPAEQEPRRRGRKPAKVIDCSPDVPAAYPGKSDVPAAYPGKSDVPAAYPGKSDVPAAYPGLADVSLISIGTSTESDSFTDESMSAISSPLTQGQEQSPPPPSSHPSHCTCTVCTSIVFSTQVARLVTRTCSGVLDESLQVLSPTPTAEETERVQISTDELVKALDNVREFLVQRKRKCDAKYNNLSPSKSVAECRNKRKGSNKKTHHSSPMETCDSFIATQLELSLTMSDCYLALLQPRQAILTIEVCLSELKLPHSVDEFNKNMYSPICDLVARAQYMLGVARIQEMECNHPEKAKHIWTNLTPSSMDKENESSGVKRSTKSSRGRTTRSGRGKVLCEVNTQVTDSSSSKQEPFSLLDSQAMEHFALAYQLCQPVSPAHLLRDTCRWLSVLVSTDNACKGLSPLFLSESMQISLTHEATLSLGVKIRSSASRSPFQHAVEAIEAITPHTQSPESPLHRARQSLLTRSPPSLPHTWAICTVCLSPRTHYSQPARLIMNKVIPSEARSKAKKGTRRSRPSKDEPVYVKLELPQEGGDVLDFLSEFADLQQRSRDSVAPCEIKEWWRVRRRLNKEMKELLDAFERDYIASSGHLLSAPPNGAVILVLGERIQTVPWETLSLLQDKNVCRMPSMTFMAAHKHMLDHSGSMTIDRQSAFYVLNPHGDLLKTETVFADWFRQQAGWEGVVGRTPTENEFITALQDKDLYVFCGHSFGQFVKTTSFQQLSCNSTALLIGCSSGRLTERGRCDPNGIALSFLTSGCPSVLGCLWDVTDGDIDRFCWALLKAKTTESTFLPLLVSSSKRACKLPYLIGAAPVVYGIPVAFRDSMSKQTE